MNLKKLLLLIGSVVLGGGVLMANGPQYTFAKKRAVERKVSQDAFGTWGATTPTISYHYVQNASAMAGGISANGSANGVVKTALFSGSEGTVANGVGSSSNASGEVTFGTGTMHSNSAMDLQTVGMASLDGFTDLIDGRDEPQRLPVDPDDPGIIPVPVGEGLWVLLLMAGGYVVAKRRKKQ